MVQRNINLSDFPSKVSIFCHMTNLNLNFCMTLNYYITYISVPDFMVGLINILISFKVLKMSFSFSI